MASAVLAVVVVHFGKKHRTFTGADGKNWCRKQQGLFKGCTQNGDKNQNQNVSIKLQMTIFVKFDKLDICFFKYKTFDLLGIDVERYNKFV